MSLDQTIHDASADESMFEQSISLQQATLEQSHKESNVHQLYKGLISSDLENTR